jgi:hypothetical protein
VSYSGRLTVRPPLPPVPPTAVEQPVGTSNTATSPAADAATLRAFFAVIDFIVAPFIREDVEPLAAEGHEG